MNWIILEDSYAINLEAICSVQFDDSFLDQCKILIKYKNNPVSDTIIYDVGDYRKRFEDDKNRIADILCKIWKYLKKGEKNATINANSMDYSRYKFI